ncbi:hypothetical protein ACJJTC_016983 [Scirpophaga incertulas]
MASIKRKSLSVEEKYVIIQCLKVGESNATTAKEFGVNHSTLELRKINKKIEPLLNANVLKPCEVFGEVRLRWLRQRPGAAPCAISKPDLGRGAAPEIGKKLVLTKSLHHVLRTFVSGRVSHFETWDGQVESVLTSSSWRALAPSTATLDCHVLPSGRDMESVYSTWNVGVRILTEQCNKSRQLERRS